MWGIKKPGPNQRQFRAGEYIFSEGDISNSLFIIRRGVVSVRKRKAGGEIEIARIFSNEALGELSFFDRQPRSASAIAVSDVEALEITFDALDKIFAKVPPYFKTIVAGIAERLRKADDIIRKLDKEFVIDSTQSSNKDEFTAADALAAIEADEEDK